MATLSLTLPISCQICLGKAVEYGVRYHVPRLEVPFLSFLVELWIKKVKDPVICANNHAFCTVCLDMWLQGNSCCPTCRVDITKEKPYRKVLGSSENNDETNLKNRTQLRKTRLELLGREYETEISNLSNELIVVNQENKRLKEELDKRPVTNSPASNNIEALSSLTKKLQEISSTYDDVRRDMNLLQEEKDRLQNENAELNMEVTKLREEAKFTRSPKRYEKFTILGLKAKVDQYEKENEQLRKALSNRDKYMEQLQNELKRIKSGDKEICEQGSQANFSDENSDNNDNIDESFPNSMIYQYGTASSSQSSCKENVSEIAKITPLGFIPSTTSCSPRPMFLEHTESYSQGDVVTPSTSEQEKEMFPATKKLLELKKMHETRTMSCSAPAHTTMQRSPGLSWSPGAQIQLANFTDTSSNSAGVSTVLDGGGRTLSLPYQNTSGQTSDDIFSSNQTNVCEVSDISLRTTPTSSDNYEAQNTDPQNSTGNVHESPKRHSSETVFMTKKIKIENPGV